MKPKIRSRAVSAYWEVVSAKCRARAVSEYWEIANEAGKPIWVSREQVLENPCYRSAVEEQLRISLLQVVNDIESLVLDLDNGPWTDVCEAARELPGAASSD